MMSVSARMPGPRNGSVGRDSWAIAWITGSMSSTALRPRCGVEECAGRPIVSRWISARPRPPRTSLRLGRLADHDKVGADGVHHRLERRALQVLLHHRRGDYHAPAQLRPVDACGRMDHRRERALHVGRAPADHRPVHDLAAERIMRPRHARRNAHRVAVSVQQQRWPDVAAEDHPDRVADVIAPERVEAHRAHLTQDHVHDGALLARQAGGADQGLGEVDK